MSAVINSKLETNTWKWFTIGELIPSIRKAKPYAKIDLNISETPVQGYIPFITRTEENNGCDGYVAPFDELIIENGNAIVIGDTTATCTYQKQPFTTGDHIIVCRAEWINEYTALFFKTILDRDRYKFNYGRALKVDIIKKYRIKLPVDQTGGPNWPWMESFIKDYIVGQLPKKQASVIKREFDISPIKSSKLHLDTSKWLTFPFTKIFVIKKGFYNKKPEYVENGAIPFIGATNSNNGITSYCDIETIKASTKTGDDKNVPLEQKLFKGNCIVVTNNGSVGYAYYQENDFTCSHDVNPLYLKNHKLNKYIALFICAVIEQDRYRWDYGRKWRPVRMENSTIKLPAVDEDHPDWEFMEQYIKSLPYSRII